jgi:hypothetical protein
MKKLLVVLIVLVSLLNCSTTYAAAYFTNNSALDATFVQLEKTFLKSKQVYMPLEGEFDVITGPVVNKVLPRMTTAVMKAAVNKRLNDIRVSIEIMEERLGGFSKEEYKKISEELLQESIVKSGEFYWESGNKTVWLTFGLFDSEFEEFDTLIPGNFKSMGKEKDLVDQAVLQQVEERIYKYFNQSIQAGNKVSPEIMKNLPSKLESLFIEQGLSKIITAQIMSIIHEEIYKSEVDMFDGSESIESIIETYQIMIEMLQEDRDFEREIEDYIFPADLPSPEVKEDFIKKILEGELSDSFTSGFSNAITLGELAKLLFESVELDERLQFEANTIDPNAPDYIKLAYIYGLIDGKDNLEKSLTRLEASRKLVKGIIYQRSDPDNILRIYDCAKIPAGDMMAVANSAMKERGINFEPQGMYTKQEAIVDKNAYEFVNLRGVSIPLYLDELSSVIVGESTVHLLFESNIQLEEYLKENFEDTTIGNVKRNGSYMRIDTGCALVELFTPEKGIKFTFKKGIKFADFKSDVYGPELSYKVEAKILKANEKVDMNMQVDSFYKKLNPKLDAILAKIIKPKMTTEQKIKVIHDYVVNHMTYDNNFEKGFLSPEMTLVAIDKGKGISAHYAYLFQYLCNRALIPCVFDSGTDIRNQVYSNNWWNAVYLNGEWKFVDTRWDDFNDKKISYQYYLKDKFTFMKDHNPKMGIPPEYLYPVIDGMNIKSQDELRVYLLREFYWKDGFKVTFKVANKSFKPDIGYVWPDPDIKAVLTYDAKKDLYTVTAKKR